MVPKFAFLWILMPLFWLTISAYPDTDPLDTEKPKVKIGLDVSNLSAVEGKLRIAVFKNAKSFLTENRYREYVVSTNGESILSHSFELPEGEYAIAIYEDVNANEVLDRNLVGYPTEKYGFSNNPAFRFCAQLGSIFV